MSTPMLDRYGLTPEDVENMTPEELEAHVAARQANPQQAQQPADQDFDRTSIHQWTRWDPSKGRPLTVLQQMRMRGQR